MVVSECNIAAAEHHNQRRSDGDSAESPSLLRSRCDRNRTPRTGSSIGANLQFFPVQAVMPVFGVAFRARPYMEPRRIVCWQPILSECLDRFVVRTAFSFGIRKCLKKEVLHQVRV